MDSVNNKNNSPQIKVHPLCVPQDVEIDVGLGSVQIGSLNCEGCSVLLYSLVDETIATFQYIDGYLKSEQTYDLSISTAYIFELATRHDLNDEPYYTISVHIHGIGQRDLINIKGFDQAVEAYTELNGLWGSFKTLH